MIISFKTISPFFEWERDGIRPFTDRFIDWQDKRFQTLFAREASQIEIVNPTTGENFIRDIVECKRVERCPNWVLIFWEPQ